jgi:hypothetical protein
VGAAFGASGIGGAVAVGGGVVDGVVGTAGGVASVPRHAAHSSPSSKERTRMRGA